MGWYPRRGQVCLVQLDKPRPAVVLSVDALNRHALDVCVVPITTKQHTQFSVRVPLKAKEGGLNFDCWAKYDQVTTIEKSLFTYAPLGTLPHSTLQKIEVQVKIALGLP
jgi:mRNA-degrading endonuclease toxin of MazEF toxin-antitoxin module